MLGIIGAGNMANALVKGILDSGLYGASDIMMSDPNEKATKSAAENYGVKVTNSNDEVAEFGDIIILAVKPQIGVHVLRDLKISGAAPLFISVMAGVSTFELEFSRQDHIIRLIRAMPNAPALIRKGCTAICSGKHATAKDIAVAEKIFECVGSVIKVDEYLMDAVVGVSGSGPAYFYMVIEALSDAGVKAGLSREQALFLAANTAWGAAAMVLETQKHPAELKDMVTSPAGTTIEALAVLEKHGVKAAFIEAVDAAVRRSKELGQ
jgi:pyrroline-5-carboxylate reductase